MPDDTPPTDPKAELQAFLIAEYRKRPWLMHCGFLCMGIFIGGFVLNFVLQGRVPVSTRFYLMAALHLVGAMAGAVGIFGAPPSVRPHQKFLKMAALFNVLFFLLYGYKAMTF